MRFKKIDKVLAYNVLFLVVVFISRIVYQLNARSFDDLLEINELQEFFASV